jgi:hypothetical protein
VRALLHKESTAETLTATVQRLLADSSEDAAQGEAGAVGRHGADGRGGAPAAGGGKHAPDDGESA